MTTRKYLVITRSGKNSLHRQWLMPESARNFDLIVAAYVDIKAKSLDDGVRYLYIPGPKIIGWNAIIKKHYNLIAPYTAVAFLDDDLSCDAAAISQCFNIGQKQNLSIWQPSLSWDSYYTFAGTLHNPNFTIRYVNYVEMMCPFFSISALNRIKDTFGLGWEVGIDLIWCSLIPDSERRCAIIDEIQIKHTRLVGKEKTTNGFADRTYEDDIYACLDFFNMEWPSLVVEKAILNNGRLINGKWIAIYTIILLRSIGITPNPRPLRLILSHIRHQIMRIPIYNERAHEKLYEHIDRRINL